MRASAVRTTGTVNVKGNNKMETYYNHSLKCFVSTKAIYSAVSTVQFDFCLRSFYI